MNRGLEAITWALEARGISPTAFRVLTQLCKRVCGDDRRHDFDVWPSQSLLAEECEISISGVKRHLQELEAARYITKSATQRHDGSKSVNRYTLMVRTRHVMPDGRRVDAKGEVSGGGGPIGQSDLCPIQSDLTDSSPLNPAQVTADLCNEPSKRTSEIEDSPLSYGEAPPAAETDLFGKASSQPIAGQAFDLAEYVTEEWKRLTDEVPGIAGARVIGEDRKKKIRSRAADFKSVEPDGRKVWDQAFATIRGSTFLRGEEPPGRNYSAPFKLTLDKLLEPARFRSILEGAFNETRNAETHDLVAGRRYGPSEQAGRAALASFRASSQQRRDGNGGGQGEAAAVAGSGSGHRPRSMFDQLRTQ